MNPAPARPALWLALAVCLAPCRGEEGAVAAPAAETPRAPVPRDATLGPFLAGHWRLPLAAQGPAPAGFTAAETSLEPEACGACHPEQLEQWRTSLHASAFSPGFAGQLIEGPLSEAAEVRQCQTCHAPLSEQQPGAPHFDAELRRQGLVCAACHVRRHRRLGPPRRAGLPAPEGPAPHGGFEARAEFQQSRFCAPCHQFFDDAGVNGKPLENTWVEWRASPQAAAGRTCQSCHMPDRAHLWRGIHDDGMVRAAVDVALETGDAPPGALVASLVLTSRDVGHAFPTYVTPRVFLELWQEGRDGAPLAGTQRVLEVGREIDFSRREEVFDTRVAPGQSVALDYRAPLVAGARALVGHVRVEPDHHYRGLFEALLPTLEDPRARALVAEALDRATASGYVLVERRLDLGAGRAPQASGS